MLGGERFTTSVFDTSILRVVFPELSQEAACSEVVLVTLFDVLCWQIRLRLLDRHSIYRMEMPIYDAEENQYRILAKGEHSSSVVARISFRYQNMNRNGYGGLNKPEREQLPDRGMFPPERLLMMSAIVVEGDELYVSSICRRFLLFLRKEADEVNLLKLLRRFARERLIDQPHPWLALDSSVAEFYSIEPPHKKE